MGGILARGRENPTKLELMEAFIGCCEKTQRQNDGSLIVRFRAGGTLEMCWYLFSWGKYVEVLEPKHLADMLADHRPRWEGLP